MAKAKIKASSFFPCPSPKLVPVREAVGLILAHDITEIRPGEFKGRAFRKGQVIRPENIDHLRRLGKEHLFVLSLGPEEVHEDEAALALAAAIAGAGILADEEPREGKINLRAGHDGLFRVERRLLNRLNLLGEVMCASIHDQSLVKKGDLVAGVRAIPLTISRALLTKAQAIAQDLPVGVSGLLEVKKLNPARVGIVITGREVYEGLITDAFAPIIAAKVEVLGCEVIGISLAPDDIDLIRARLTEFLDAGADLIIATGGMSVDPDDVTRFAIRSLGAKTVYGSAVLPGAMFLVGYLKVNSQQNSKTIPILGIPACGMYHKITILDLVLPRILANEKIGRRELARLGHGGLCLNCGECRFPVCPFGKG
jgi:molybdenum cofactor synthesis domain-containing protein